MNADKSCQLSKLGKRTPLLLPIFFILFSTYSFAEELTILYTGNTHAALYHCNCPKEPDGGLGRRMTKVAQLRQMSPNIILVDAGGFFAGGVFDDHSQGVALDKIRSDINLEALGLMGYDGLNIGDDELNLGKDYLLEAIAKSRVPFLSANLRLKGTSPYMVKKIAGRTIAIIGLTNDEARAKLEGLPLEDPLEALKKSIQEVKSQKADLVLVLSYLGEEKERGLIGEVEGIDILISGRSMDSVQPYSKIGSTILLRPVWQGRRLGRINLSLEGSKIKNFSVEQIRISGEIPDAPEITKILPQCFTDNDCRKDSLSGLCNNPGKKEAGCVYGKPKEIELLVIKNNNIPAPNETRFIESLRLVFPGIAARFIDYESKEGKLWINNTQAKLLPIYLLAKDAQGEKGFDSLSRFLELKGDYYYINPRVSGASFFVGRKRLPRRLDVFLGTKERILEAVLSSLRELQTRHRDLMINIHFLAIDGPGGFSVPGGLIELEEDLRQVCIQHYFPQKFWDYALCRSKNQDSSWWDNCAEAFGIDTALVKKCSLSSEGLDRLRENTKLGKELEIAGGPAMLIDNQAIFIINPTGKVEDLENLILGVSGSLAKKE